MAENRKRNKKIDIAMLIFTIIGMILFLLNYTTGYYQFGQRHSVMIICCLFGAVVAELVSMYARENYPEKEWPFLILTAAVVLICWGAGMLLMDRIEAVGTCVITDFDSGHGGEEAVYQAFVALLFFLAAVVLGIIKSFTGVNKRKVVGADAD